MKNSEFWDSFLTEKSWNILQELNKKYRFILIGGWAVYLLAKQKKSKDIDIVLGIRELEMFKTEGLRKNENLRKYEIKRGEIDIDIYVEYYSKLAIPAEDVSKFSIKLDGFNVAPPELMLVLKQSAFIDREYFVKGEKDKIDIISLVFFTDVDFRKYYDILKEYKLESYSSNLKRIIKEFKDYNSLNLTPAQLKRKKNVMLEELKKN